jgi:hypothetical protein
MMKDMGKEGKAVLVCGLRKTYQGHQAFDGIDGPARAAITASFPHFRTIAADRRYHRARGRLEGLKD